MISRIEVYGYRCLENIGVDLPRYGVLVGANAAGKTTALDLQQRNPFRFRLWEEHVRTGLPNMERIELKEREEDHHVYFRIFFQGGCEVTSSGLSEGALRMLALTILPYLDHLPAMVFLEEPENGIHPRAIEVVLQSLSSVYDSQVLISSHSSVVLANSELRHVLCFHLHEKGGVSIVRGIDHPQLREWKGQIDLGALFAEKKNPPIVLTV
jgi:predicted ATPase